MKKTTLILSVCSLLGCTLSSNAAVDIMVNGNQYAVTTFTGTFNQLLASDPTVVSQPFVQAALGNATAGMDTGTGFNPTSQYHQYIAQAAAIAYVNAVSAGGTGVTLQDAENTEFLTVDFGNGNVELANNNQVSYLSANSSFIYAEVTALPVPEPAAYAWATASMLVGFLGVSTFRKSRQNTAA